MAKMIECAKMDPRSGCTVLIRADTEEEVLKLITEHAVSHGIHQVTPEFVVQLKANIVDVV